MTPLRRLRPSPAMVVAFIALAVSVTSGAYAAVRITSASIVDGAVTHPKLANNSVWNAQLGKPSVRTANINNGAVTHSKMGKNVTWNAQLGKPAVRTVNINNGAVTSAKLAAGAVQDSNLSPQLLAQINASSANLAVVNVPAVTAGQHTGAPGDQGFFFSGVDAQGSAQLAGGQLVLHGSDTDTTTQQATIGIAKAFSNVPLKQLDALSYQWHVDQLHGGQAPTVEITVSGMSNPSGVSNLVYSPGLAGGNGVTVSKSQQYQSDGLAPNAVWYATGASGAGSISRPEPLSFFVQNDPNAVITQITLGNGGTSGSTAPFEAGADNLVIGFSGSRFTRYDFDG